MKGLIYKDICSLSKQLKLFGAMILIFAIFLPDGMSTFGLIYVGMLPITALAYDERSKWNKLAAMMPYSKTELVLSKYVLSYGMIFIAFVAWIAIRAALSLFTDAAFNADVLLLGLAAAAASTVIVSINLPMMIRFGVEKARLLFIAISVVVAIGATVLAETQAAEVGVSASLPVVLLVAVGVVALNLLSAFLSVKLYRGAEA